MGRKNALQVELQQVGAWDAFVELREELKSEGLTPQEAQRQATDEIRRRITEGEFSAGDATEGDGRTKHEEPGFARLRRLVDRESSAGYAAQIGWIADNLILEWDEIDPAAIPCMAALAQLYFIRCNRAEKEWLFTVWTKLVPSRSVIDKGGGFDDSDGQTDRELSRQLGQALDSGEVPEEVANGLAEDSPESDE